MVVGGADTRLGNLLDGSLSHVDEGDVVAVERLVVVGVEAEPARPEWVVRAEFFRQHGVPYRLSDLSPYKLGHDLVRRPVRSNVGEEIGHPMPAVRPLLLEHLQLLFRRIGAQRLRVVDASRQRWLSQGPFPVGYEIARDRVL